LSFASAWLALLPQALCVSYATLVWASREMEVILMFAGQLGCEALNFVLKRIIKEERPKGECYWPSITFPCVQFIPLHKAGKALTASMRVYRNVR
jgi:hypothetical protein